MTSDFLIQHAGCADCGMLLIPFGITRYLFEDGQLSYRRLCFSCAINKHPSLVEILAATQARSGYTMSLAFDGDSASQEYTQP